MIAPVRPQEIDKIIGPDRAEFSCHAQFAPTLTKGLDVGNRIRHMRIPQPIEPSRATAEVHRCLCNDRYQLLNRMIDCRADGTRRAVDMLQRRRHLLKKQHRALGA